MNYTTKIDSFLFRRSWGKAFMGLEDVEAGQLIRAIYTFINGEKPKLDDPELIAIFEIMSSQLNESARRYVLRRFDDIE